MILSYSYHCQTICFDFPMFYFCISNTQMSQQASEKSKKKQKNYKKKKLSKKKTKANHIATTAAALAISGTA